MMRKRACNLEVKSNEIIYLKSIVITNLSIDNDFIARFDRDKKERGKRERKPDRKRSSREEKLSVRVVVRASK